MSARLVQQVLESRLVPVALKLTAVVMAAHAADDGTSVYPSIARVGRQVGIEPRNARKWVRELERLRILQKTVDGGGRKTSRWVFNSGALGTFPQFAQLSTGRQHPGTPDASVRRSVIDQSDLLLKEIPKTETAAEANDRRLRREALDHIKTHVLRSGQR